MFTFVHLWSGSITVTVILSHAKHSRKDLYYVPDYSLYCEINARRSKISEKTSKISADISACLSKSSLTKFFKVC